MDPFALLLPLGVALVGAMAWGAWQWEKRHREALVAFAASSGWSHTPRDDSWTRRFDGTPFGRGDRRRATNVLRGSYGGREMVAFDYSFQTSSTDGNGNRSTQTHRFNVCALALPAWLPFLELTPENVLTRLGGAVGLRDVELESDDFNRRYRVDAPDPKFAYDVLHPQSMEALLAQPTMNLRLRGADALSWDKGRMTPVPLLARLSTLSALLDGIPSYVWSDHGFEADRDTPNAPRPDAPGALP